MKSKKIFFRTVFIILAVIILIIGGYAVYLFADYHRIEDNQTLQIQNNTSDVVSPGIEYDILSYNIGFAAYTPEFSFFMDGGTESRAFSKDSVIETMNGITSLLHDQDADFMFIQEVDEKATRSHHVNERAMLEESFSDRASSFAVNYDSSYLFYPFTEPHGKSLAGILTLSKFSITDSLRRSLPIEESVMKFVDLDRCYSVSRVTADNGKELVLYNIHLSAYTSDGTIATEQLEMLISDMQSEYDKGNYIVCGGDFNKDLLGDSSKYFGISGGEYTWAQPIPDEMFDGVNLTLIAPLDPNSPSPSCRNADAPFHDDQYVLTVDGFIVSDNVNVIKSSVIDTDFLYSDHEPVRMTFVLE